MEVDAFMLVSNFGRFAAALVVGCLILAVIFSPLYFEEKRKREYRESWYKSDSSKK